MKVGYGAMVVESFVGILAIIIAATVGSVVGAYFLYGIGRLLSQELSLIHIYRSGRRSGYFAV